MSAENCGTFDTNLHRPLGNSYWSSTSLHICTLWCVITFLQSLNCCVRLHSGLVIASVLCNEHVCFPIFVDTMNTASWMESNDSQNGQQKLIQRERVNCKHPNTTSVTTKPRTHSVILELTDSSPNSAIIPQPCSLCLPWLSSYTPPTHHQHFP